MKADHQPRRESPRRPQGDWLFLAAFGVIAACYVLLILAMLVADAAFTSWADMREALTSREIRYAIWLSLISCTLTTILSLWIAVPTGYLLSRTQPGGHSLYQSSLDPRGFRARAWRIFRHVIDAILDIPIVLPPLVIGLSLLILFQTPPGKWIERQTTAHIGQWLTWGMIPLLLFVTVGALVKLTSGHAWRGRAPLLGAILAVVLYVALIGSTGASRPMIAWLRSRLSTPITYAVPSVVIAQFAVAAAFAVRTMRVTFDQINPRSEQVAMTLGCTRGQAFFMVVLPEARRGMLTAATLAWARSLGEFGPILVFSGATRLRTEVLPTSVFLELSVGRIQAAVAVSLLMVACAVIVLVIVRAAGTRDPMGAGF